MTDKRVAIFGAGPAGLASAHAAYLSGAWVHIFSRATKSRLYGCQYLHAPLPEIYGIEQRTVKYELRGTPEEYREKVYGLAWTGKVSPNDLEGEHKAWDIRATYDGLWDLYGPQAKGRAQFAKAEIDNSFIYEFGRLMPNTFDHIISTVPAPNLCADNFGVHSFFAEEIWAIGDAADHGQVAPVTTPPDTIICNGKPEPSWYRVSNVFGATTVEWPSRKKPPISGVVKVKKPLYTNCNCYPEIIRMGRYGAWKKDQLVHHVFEQTLELLK